MEPDTRLKAALAENGYRLTTVRKTVYETLLDAARPLTNAEVISLLPDMDRVSIYRTLDMFEKVKIIHRIWNGFKSKVELSDKYLPHHHHFSCQNCGITLSFKDASIEAALHEIEREINAKITSHVVELSGTCSNCTRRPR